MKIYLIGMPASGKTTLGEALAHKLKLQFLDLDQFIEYKATMFIDEIFDAYGEEWFRTMETNCLETFKDAEDIVIATGGGIVLKDENKELMKNGKIIYLYVPVEELEKRIEPNDDTRPLLLENKIGKLYLERKEKYESFADMTVDNTYMTQAINKIMEELK